MREIVFPKEEHINLLANTKWSGLKTLHTNKVIHTESVILGNICV